MGEIRQLLDALMRSLEPEIRANDACELMAVMYGDEFTDRRQAIAKLLKDDPAYQEEEFYSSVQGMVETFERAYRQVLEAEHG